MFLVQLGESGKCADIRIVMEKSGSAGVGGSGLWEIVDAAQEGEGSELLRWVEYCADGGYLERMSGVEWS